jgi:four helix bundle protein
MPPYTNLLVWKQARVLVNDIYHVIDVLPTTERFNLGDQLRRAAISIVSNIAEGSRRIHKKEKRQFYTVAYGSASEIEAQLMIIEDLKMAPTELLKKTQEELQSVLRLTNRLLNVFR